MFTSATDVTINGKNVKSIVTANGGVLYMKAYLCRIDFPYLDLQIIDEETLTEVTITRGKCYLEIGHSYSFADGKAKLLETIEYQGEGSFVLKHVNNILRLEFCEKPI